jgi:hypothetical protein
MKYFSITNLNQVYYIEVLKACFIIDFLRNRKGFRSGDKYVFNYRLVSHQTNKQFGETPTCRKKATPFENIEPTKA